MPVLGSTLWIVSLASLVPVVQSGLIRAVRLPSSFGPETLAAFHALSPFMRYSGTTLPASAN